MKNSPNIAVIAIMNTKGGSIELLTDLIRRAGGNPLVIDISIGESERAAWIDVTPEELLSGIGVSPEKLHAMTKREAAGVMIQAGSAYVATLLEEKKIDGIIGYAGGIGTRIISGIMSSIPIGVPKLLLSSVAGNVISDELYNTDICLMQPVFELGINYVTRELLNEAAHGIVAMASAKDQNVGESRPAIGYTMLGITTPCVLEISKHFEAEGFDTMIAHGDARKLEKLIRQNVVDSFFDISLSDITNYVCPPLDQANPDRMTPAIDMKIPLVVAPGGMETLCVPINEVPDWLQKEIDEKKPGRGCYAAHLDAVFPGCTADEAYQMGKVIAEKVNKAEAPVVLLVPMRGWSGADIGYGDLELGWAGPGASPAWLPCEDDPERSARSVALVRAYQDFIDRSNENVHMFTVDTHFNDPKFAEVAIAAMKAIRSGEDVEQTAKAFSHVAEI